MFHLERIGMNEGFMDYFEGKLLLRSIFVTAGLFIVIIILTFISPDAKAANPSVDGTELILNHTDGGELYAGYQYTWVANVSDGDGITDIYSVVLRLDDTGDDQRITWWESNDTFESNSPYFTVNSGPSDSYNISAQNRWIINFTITFNWNWHNVDDPVTLIDDRVEVTDDSMTMRFNSYTTDSWKCENDLRIYYLDFNCDDNYESGTGNISDNDWLRGNTWVNTTGNVTYEDTNGIYPPSSAAIRAQLWTNGVDRGASYQNTLNATGWFTILNYQVSGTTDTDYDFDIILENLPTGATHNSANDIESDSRVDSRIDATAPSITGGTWTESSQYLWIDSGGGDDDIYYGNDMGGGVTGTLTITGTDSDSTIAYVSFSPAVGSTPADDSGAPYTADYLFHSTDTQSGTLTIKIFDGVGNVATDSSTWRYFRDNNDPGVTYNNPTAGGDTSWYNSNPGGNYINIDFIWGGAGNAPMDEASYRIGAGSWVPIFTTDRSTNYNTNWGVPWASLSEGANLISVSVQDVVGNVRTDTYVASTTGFRVLVDTEDPTITYNSPSAGGDTNWYNSDPGNIIDIDFIWIKNAPLDYAEYQIGAGGWTSIFSPDQASDYITNWGINWGSLSQGPNEISIRVYDLAGNSAFDTYSVSSSGFRILRDTTDPTIVYNSPSAGGNTSWYNTDPGNLINIDFTWDSYSPLDYAQYRIGSGGSWNYIFSISQNATYSTDWGIPWGSLSDGVNSIDIRIYDGAGNSLTHTYTFNTQGFNFLKDTTVPNIVYNNPAAGSDSNWYSSNPGNFINIDFGHDGFSPLDYAQYRIGSGNWINIFSTDRTSDYTTNWDLTWGAVPQGVTEVSIRVFDLAGNEINHSYSASTSGFRVRRDTTAPGIIYNNPDQGDNTSWYGSDPGPVIDIDFNWIANAPLTNASFRIGTGQWELIFDSEMSTDYTTDWSLNWSALQEGENQIHLRAFDKAGNMVLHSYTLDTTGFLFKKDITPPVPNSFSINNGDEFTNSTSVTLSISASDSGSGLYQMRISNDGTFDTEPWETYATSKVWTLTTSDGNKTVYIMFRDNALVESVLTFSDYILLDTTPPVIQNWTLTPGNVTEDTTQVFNITVEVSDLLGSGVLTVEIDYTINGLSSNGFTDMKNINITESLWSIIIDPAELGTGYTWDELQGKTINYTIRISDRAGNVALSLERIERIEPINDPPLITSDDDQSAVEDELYSVSYKAIDIDPTGDTLTWSLDTNASWLTIDPSTGVLSGTPGTGTAGTYRVNVTVSDGNGGIDWHSFTLWVTSFPNNNPIITTNNVLNAEVDKSYSVDYEATDDRTPVANLVWTMQTNASWLSINSATGVLSGTPQDSDLGSYWVKVTVGDGEGGFASTNFTIRVTKPPIINNKPELTDGKMEPSSGDTDTEFTFSVEYTDADDEVGDVYVWIDGDQYKMDPDPNDSDYTDGVLFTLETKLDEGTHDYYFSADDGTDDAEPGDNTPTTTATATSTPEIEKAEPSDGDGDGESNLLMFAGIAIVIIIIIILLLFMFMRGRGGGPGEGDLDEPGEPSKPRIVGPVKGEGDLEEEYEEEYEEEFEEEEYPYDEVSEPGGYEDVETGELSEEAVDFEESLEADTQISAPLKPAIGSLDLEDKMEVIELGLVMPCSVCQGIMPMGEKAFQCTCGLVSHKDCVGGLNVCPQCGKEITVPELKAKVEPAKKKLPLIRKEMKREVEEVKPPTKAFFTFIPGKTSEKELADYIGGYFKSSDLGSSEKNDDLRFVRLFITPDSARIMLDHCYKHGRKKEVMGLMIGQSFHYKNEEFSVVKNVVTSELEATEVNVKFDSFEKLFDQLDELDYEYQIIGWYHSHPSYTSFMSPTDVDTQARMFKHPYQYAIVIDPIKNDMNAFTLDQVKKNKVKEKPFAIIEP
jgi:proteasome lid subunit RPN8/RPN11